LADVSVNGLLPARPIKVLPEGLANRIAAGEVVERPASVAKELIENALDAEATKITVSVKKAGFDELLVSDNGWGMSEEDVVLSFRRHATSKITCAEDLQRIMHLGFRGEALPSIGSVARVEVTSCRADSDSAVCYRVDGGQTSGPEPAAREQGTTVKVRSLFYNVPARRKFMRTPATEYGHLVKAFKRYALSYPQVGWELVKEDSTVWSLEPTDLVGRICQLFGDEFRDDLHLVESKSGDIVVDGVVGGSALFKRSKGDQFLFVNKRPFQSTALNHAVSNGFGPLIEYGQNPFYAINLRLDPEEFDVNVHPAKHEIRFRDDGMAYRAVLVAVRGALGLALRSGDSPIKVPVTSKDNQDHSSRYPQGGRKELELLFGRPPEQRSPYKPIESNIPPVNFETSASISLAPSTNSSEPETAIGSHGEGFSQNHPQETFKHEPTSPSPVGETAQRVNVWQVHKTYIFSQTKSGIVIIDQHVAHERILYEKALDAMQDRPWSGQQLLFPVTVRLDPGDSALIEEIAPGLKKMGFDVEPFGGRDWVVRSVPAGIKVKSEEKLLKEMLEDYRSEYDVKMKPEETLAASFACKAAIKAGDPLNLEEMNALIDELFTTKYPFVCPHGRPIIVNLTVTDLNRMFGRE
jgi:DNA mismatch repair protein MutL